MLLLVHNSRKIWIIQQGPNMVNGRADVIGSSNKRSKTTGKDDRMERTIHSHHYLLIADRLLTGLLFPLPLLLHDTDFIQLPSAADGMPC